MATNIRLQPSDYNVAWICALPDVELDPARLMLDTEYETPFIDTVFDDNTYICGTIKGHRIVIACLPKGDTGNFSASRLTYPMFRTFSNIKIALLVGIGGGVPRPSSANNPLDEIYLGDVVIGWPGDGKDAVVYYDLGNTTADGGFEIKGRVKDPEWNLKQALGVLRSNQRLRRTTFIEHVENLSKFPDFLMPGRDRDQLFEAGYQHHAMNERDCNSCDLSKLVKRPKRTDVHQNTFVFHTGRIATGNSVIKDGEKRDQISKRCDGALCIEMEAAGVNINGSCLVIRGISDYADSHKNDTWKNHAAGNAAIFARELLCILQAGDVRKMEGHVENVEITVPATETRPKKPRTITSNLENTSKVDSAPVYQTEGKTRTTQFDLVPTTEPLELPGSRP